MAHLNKTTKESIKIKESDLLEILKFRSWLKQSLPSIFSILLRRKFFVKGLMNEGEVSTVLLEKIYNNNYQGKK